MDLIEYKRYVISMPQTKWQLFILIYQNVDMKMDFSFIFRFLSFHFFQIPKAQLNN